jgi:hypothetical protein
MFDITKTKGLKPNILMYLKFPAQLMKQANFGANQLDLFQIEPLKTDLLIYLLGKERKLFMLTYQVILEAETNLCIET